jgi:sarcosine oxidase
VYLQEDSGVLRAAESVRTQARLAVAAGAELREEVDVVAVRATGDGVEVHTDGDAFTADVAVVAAGAWAPAVLADAGVDVPLAPSLEQVTYFALDEPEPLPTLIERWDDGVHADYAVPDPWEPGAFKVGLHQGGDGVDPSRRPTDPDPRRLARSRAHAAERFAAHHETGVVDTCLYTNTPDEDFVLDRVGPVVIASPCSGHGFKFVPLLGRVIADLATGQPAEVPLERFRVARFST